jgi:hypothetical protein
MVRTGAAWVVTLLVLSLSSVDLPHLTGAHHDADFDLVVVTHDASSHRVSGGENVEPVRPDHCLACHWGRSFRPGTEPGILSAPVDETALVLVSDQRFAPVRALVAQPPLRSPPASPIPS